MEESCIHSMEITFIFIQITEEASNTFKDDWCGKGKKAIKMT
jgi:hypothetical protein